MKSTANLELKLPEATDPFSMKPLNENMEKLDKNAKEVSSALKKMSTSMSEMKDNLLGFALFAVGSYRGTGKYGEENPNRIRIGFKPAVVLVVEGNGGVMLHTNKSLLWIGGDLNATHEWYNKYSATSQLNEDGVKYSWFALGFMENNE